MMKIVPAIDILNGQVARLFQGDYDKASYYSLDPTLIAQNFAAQGYSYLHVIDLLGAKVGSPQILNEIKNILSLGLDIQVGGGIRSIEKARAYLEAGVKRVIIGTQALIQSDFIDELIATFNADSIMVSLDVRDGKLGIQGWLQEHNRSLEEVFGQLEQQGVQHIIVTDITRDGTLAGSNTLLYEPLVKSFPSLNIYAAGGIASQNDIDNLTKIGLSGAIVGKAFYEQNFVGLQSC